MKKNSGLNRFLGCPRSQATVASAQTYTYEFTGTNAAGNYPANFIDGSTLTISDGNNHNL